uniref:Solute carrier organic anion transporter family member n=1 Tax=Panagrolaimus sp. JU765 TaxID=591449 RepID=A0AC34RHL5_9BILA
MQNDGFKDRIYSKFRELNDGDDSDATAETRSAPGDLAKLPDEAGTSGENVAKKWSQPEKEEDFGIEEVSVDESVRKPQKKGHVRGTRSNGFASGPPFPVKPKREAPWSTIDEKQKQQQIELIDKEINELTKEAQCGIGKFRPKWLQKMATRGWLLFFLCWFCAIQGMLINGLVPSSISTIERRFELSTSTMGRIMQFYDFGYVLFCIPVSYFGGRHSKSLVLGVGLACMAFGSFVFTWPHLLADSYTTTYNNDDGGLSQCYESASPNETLSRAQAALIQCPSPENQPRTFRYVILFSLAHFLHGIGATPLFTIGVSYIDENVGPAQSSLFLGIFYAFAIFGPAFGFLMSSTFLKYHTDFLQTGKDFASILMLDESDPKWVGAWWIGFQIVCVLALIAVPFILAMPKVLPESLKWHRTRLREETLTGGKKRTPECCGVPSSSKTAAITGSLLQIDDKATTNVVAESMPALKIRPGPIWYQLWLDVRHIPIAIYRILLNGPYMLITTGMAVDGLIITGVSTFMSKYLERQFGVAPSKANMLIGGIMVPMAGIGTVMSGYVIQRFRLSCARTIKFCILLLVASLFFTPMYFIYCDHDKMVGIETDYPSDEPFYKNMTSVGQWEFSLDASCNNQCVCSNSEYRPVCAEFTDGSQLNFFSPCYAGCSEKWNPLSKEYLNCSCVPPNTKGGIRRVKKGYCESKCKGLFGFLVAFAPFCFFTFAVGVPLIIVVLRTVDYAERAFALGIQWILVRIIGTIPAPVIFGWLFDVSCIRQHTDSCSGERGSCMLYNNKLLSDLFFAFSVAGQLVAILCLVLVLILFTNLLKDDPLPTEENRSDPEKVPGQTELEPMLVEKQPLPVECVA